MFDKCSLICFVIDAGMQAWLAGGGEPALVFSANQLRGRLAIGEALPEQLVFDGSLKDCIHIFSEQSIEEGSEQINAYLEQGAAEWTENGWEQFTCRTAVLGCCSGFYLSIVNKKDL